MANDQLRPLVELGASLPFWCVNLCGGTKAWRMTSVVKFPVKSMGKSEIRLRFGHLGHPRIAAGRVPERPKFCWRMVGICWDSTEHQRIFPCQNPLRTMSRLFSWYKQLCIAISTMFFRIKIKIQTKTNASMNL